MKWIRLALLEPVKVGAAVLRFIILNWPNTPLGIALRRRYVSMRAASVGRNFVMQRGCDIAGYHLLRIGDNATISESVVINLGPGDYELRLGSDSFIGPGTYVRNMNHNYTDPVDMPDRPSHTGTDIVIGDHVWIAARCILLAGARVGDHAIVGAGSVVRSEIPPNAIAAGNPARVVRLRAQTEDQAL
jgi:acetyltransferase-like isoleucine patch superfamily enzyme